MSLEIPSRLSPVRSVCAALVLLGLAGCCSDAVKAYPAMGRVIYKGTGEPAGRLAGGQVVLEVPAGSGTEQVRGEIEDDGTFSLGSIMGGKNVGGVLPGDYRVRIAPPRDPEKKRPIRGVLHPRYESFDKSQIRVTVKTGPNDFVIEVDRPRR